jgi:proline dehydrogenase
MPILNKYTLGIRFEEALDHVKKYNDQGIACSLSHLPLLKNNPWSIDREIRMYFRMLDRIKSRELNCDVTVKLHQLGVYGKPGLTEKSIKQIVGHASGLNNFVWVDMERRGTVDITIELYRELYQQYPESFGICLQTYLHRTQRDMKLLLAKGLPMRLVKGFYKDYDFPTWKEVTENYRTLMPYVMDHSSKPAIATHDLELLDEAKRYIVANGLKDKVEFQFFKCVRDDMARQLTKEGFRARIYVPFGSVFRFLIDGFTTFDVWHQIERMIGFSPWP